MHFFCLKMLGVVLLLAGCSQKNESTKESGTEKGTASTANNSGLRSAETNDTDAATNDMSGVLLDALKNKRLHFGTQLFKPICIQFNHNGTVGIFPPEGKIERVTYSMRGLRVGFHEGEEEIDFEIKFFDSTIEAGDKLSLFMDGETDKGMRVEVILLEDLPNGEMAEIISGKRIYFNRKERVGWVQFNSDFSYIDDYSYMKKLFWVEGTKITIPMGWTKDIVITFKNQSLNGGDMFSIEQDGEVKEVQINRVEPASKPKGLSAKEAINSTEYNLWEICNIIASWMGGNGKTTRYADLHSRKWCDFVLNKGKESGVRLEKFLSFQLPRTAALQESIKLDKSEKRVSHFAFNNAMSGALVGGYSWQGRGPVLVFECDLGWNGYGGFEDALKYAEINGLESIAVGFESNQVEMVAKEDLKNLDWDGTSRRLEKSAKGFWTIGEGEKNILNWRGRNVRDVLRCFGNPTSAKPFGENGGAWLYKGLGITNEDGESQDSVTFIVQNGIVRDVKLKPSKLTPLP